MEKITDCSTVNLNLKECNKENNPGPNSGQKQIFRNEDISHTGIVINKGKIVLTSKRNAKHVTFDESSSDQFPITSNESASNIIDNVESCVTNGMTELRKYFSAFNEEKSAFNQHIRCLQESLKEANTWARQYRDECEEKDSEIRKLQQSLKELKSNVSKLEQETENIQSEHSDHLQSIAQRQRRKRLAKRSVEQWKKKLKMKDSCLVSKLQTENAFLKQELIVYQESTKQAFLRSANVLNSEAVTIFQNSAKRILKCSDENMKKDDCCRSDSETMSESSYQDDSSDHPDDSYSKRKYLKGNEKSKFYDKRHTRPILVSKAATCTNCEDTQQIERPLTENNKDSSPRRYSKYETEKYTPMKPKVPDYFPQPLRKETRHIIQQLQSTNKRSSDSPLTPRICGQPRCQCAPGKSTCNTCSRPRNLGLANMPIDCGGKSRGGSKSGLSKGQCRNVLYANMNRSDTGTKVIYQPSGSTVVIEKHLQR